MICDYRYRDDIASMSADPAGPPFVGTEIGFEDCHPPIREVHAYWRAKQALAGGPPALPRKADIQPWEIKAHLGRINLIDVLHEPEDFVYRLYGSAFTGLVRQELNGRSVLAVRPASYARLLLAHFREARDRAEPMIHVVRVKVDDIALDYQRLCLPLSRAGGTRADFLLTYGVAGNWDGLIFEQHCLQSSGQA